MKAYKVIGRGRSLFSKDKYALSYEIDKITEALPNTVGIFCYKDLPFAIKETKFWRIFKLIEKKNKEEVEMYCSSDINPIKFNKGFYICGQKPIILDKGLKIMNERKVEVNQIGFNKNMYYSFNPVFFRNYVFGSDFFASASIVRRKMLPTSTYSDEMLEAFNTTLPMLLTKCSVRNSTSLRFIPLHVLINKIRIPEENKKLFKCFDMERIKWFLSRLTAEELLCLNIKMYRGGEEKMLFFSFSGSRGDILLFCISSIKNEFISEAYLLKEKRRRIKNFTIKEPNRERKVKIGDFLKNKSNEELDQLLDTPMIQSLIQRAKERGMI